MISWQFVVLLVLLGVALVALLDSPVRRWRTIAQLRSSGRSIHPSTALTRAESGEYVIVENRTSLPGEWWLIRAGSKQPDFVDLRDTGWVIHPVDKETELLLRNRTSNQLVDIMPFED